ncbi:cell wall elongation regulator TseB-like domain-containing protein [Rossellomorea sp. LjRoot5]|uniref:cell wall elongation regulator TseB-like domain-containing protein n=1 Tax=Rossellomorea sp. LjRoot5 TaxID=3342331 RepID=UPI003ED03443
MKKWITIIVLLFIVIGISASVLLYQVSRNPLDHQRDLALKRVKDETAIVKVEDTSFYNGSKSYVVVTGENEQKEKLVAWVPDKKGKIIEKKWANGITKDQAINKLNDEKKPKELLSVRLGYESVGPVWEMTYLDQQDNLNYYYLLFSSGEWWRKIENL